MKKNSIYLVGIMVAVLMLAGCRNADAKEAGANADGVSKSQETTASERNSQESGEEETNAVSDPVSGSEEEIIVEGNEGIIRVGTTGTPYMELLTQAKIQLAKKGWDVQVEIYSDYEKINRDVINGNLDAHLFAHRTYIDSYNDVNGTQLITAGEICFEKYGIYSVLNEDLTKITSGIKMGIPEDGTRRAKALLFLQDAGYITLNEKVGLTAILEDVTDNPMDIEFVTYNKDNVQSILKTVDYCVMGANQAILAGLEPHKEVLKEEIPSFESAKALATLLVTTSDKANSEGLRLLEKALKSEETQKYAEDTYKGALELFP